MRFRQWKNVNTSSIDPHLNVLSEAEYERLLHEAQNERREDRTIFDKAVRAASDAWWRRNGSNPAAYMWHAPNPAPPPPGAADSAGGHPPPSPPALDMKGKDHA